MEWCLQRRDFGFVGFCQRPELFLIMENEAMDTMDKLTDKSRVSLGQMIIDFEITLKRKQSFF